MLDEYQNENNKKKGRKKETTERSIRNPEAMVDTNDLIEEEKEELLLLSVTDVFPSANRFLKSANIQGAAITLLTVMFVSIQLLFSSSNINKLHSCRYPLRVRQMDISWIYFLHDTDCSHSIYSCILQPF